MRKSRDSLNDKLTAALARRGLIIPYKTTCTPATKHKTKAARIAVQAKRQQKDEYNER